MKIFVAIAIFGELVDIVSVSSKMKQGKSLENYIALDILGSIALYKFFNFRINTVWLLSWIIYIIVGYFFTLKYKKNELI